jgi:hypothetical protein
MYLYAISERVSVRNELHVGGVGGNTYNVLGCWYGTEYKQDMPPLRSAGNRGRVFHTALQAGIGSLNNFSNLKGSGKATVGATYRNMKLNLSSLQVA